ncbi:deleted in malignant brain tumors 1 protein-like [Acanthaster planci]|uniref:Deleted in malignant brain tumors 1 protein-like n=1 Tax=Acanthaster planci TaxID=133434 RepID=A0A8B7ZFB2_ACAPL|nr:deleted in malignant brain tumors 1 protein-like [Acanthaster planci]
MRLPVLTTILTAVVLRSNGLSQYDLRLVGGNNSLEGRVEVYVNGTWGTVCDQKWDLVDATVTCRQLGYGMAWSAVYGAYFGQGSGKIVFADVECLGWEDNLHSCLMNTHNNCTHSQDAGVICTGTNYTTGEYDVLLVGGSSTLEGRVEVYVKGRWGTICDDQNGWGMNEASVVCRQLGFRSAKRTSRPHEFGRGTGDIVLGNVRCNGSESNLQQCVRHEDSHVCLQYIAVGVVCSNNERDEYDIQLVGSSIDRWGRVEVYVDGTWGTICGEGWDIDDAAVVCWQLGYGKPTTAPDEWGNYGQGSGDIFSVTCRGTEDLLIKCTWGYVNNCDYSTDAVVVCSPPDGHSLGQTLRRSLIMAKDGKGIKTQVSAVYVKCLSFLAEKGSVRLVDGASLYEGRVEINVGGIWGTICDRNGYWDKDEADVVCGQLGYSYAKSSKKVYMGTGTAPILIGDVICSGYESKLDDCSFTDASMACIHQDDVGVECIQSPSGSWSTAAIVGIVIGGIFAVVLLFSLSVKVYRSSVTHSPGAPQVSRSRTSHDDIVGLARATSQDDSVSDSYRDLPPPYSDVISGSSAYPVVHSGGPCSLTTPSLRDPPSSQPCPPSPRCSTTPLPDSSGMRLPLLTTILTAVVIRSNGLSQYDLRLVGGNNSLEGRVEVYVNGTWGTVCDQKWDLVDATVTCRQLGYGMAWSAVYGAYFGQGSGKIVFADVECLGWEDNLHSCLMNTYNNCTHSQDAGVICTGTNYTTGQYAVGLAYGRNHLEGRLVVFNISADGPGGTVCDAEWDLNDAAVVCRQLGYGRASAAVTGALFFGWGSTEIVFNKVNCKGTESSLLDCQLSISEDCSGSSGAGVICTGTDYTTGQTRLVNGTDALSGLVEVYLNGSWGTVCGEGWDIADGTVVCGQMDYGKATEANGWLAFGPGKGNMVLDGISCTGKENNLMDCPRNASVHDCDPSRPATVMCSTPNRFDLRLRNGSSYLEGRVEMYKNGVWWIVCDEGWDIVDAMVTCRQLGYGKATSAPRSAFFGNGKGWKGMGPVNCDGTESKLHYCTQETFPDPCYAAGAVCSHVDEYDVLLVGGSSTLEGRVEVYVKGRWGTICNDQNGWGMNEASVVCRQLGFRSAKRTSGWAEFEQGTGDIVLGNVRCNGTESNLQQCVRHEDPPICWHNQVVGVKCSYDERAEHDVQLISGFTGRLGRVEVYVDGTWGTICGEGWDIDDATVVCWQLGYGKPSSAPGWGNYGQGSGDIYSVTCRGTESMLSKCAWDAVHNCNHSKDAVAICSTPDDYDVRLVDGTNKLEGRVEVYLDGTWGTICDDGWDINDATVVCRQLGYGGATSALNEARFGRGSGDIKLTNVACSAAQKSLSDCPKSYSTYICSHFEDAGVVCKEKNTAEEGSVRLVDGASLYEGRVEINLGGIWGTICDRNGYWGKDEADVVCGQLGYSYAKSSKKEYIGTGTAPILIGSVICYGYESKLDDCYYNYFTSSCTHEDDVGVECNQPGSWSTTAIVAMAIGGIFALVLLFSLGVKLYRPSVTHSPGVPQVSSRSRTSHDDIVGLARATSQDDSVSDSYRDLPPSYRDVISGTSAYPVVHTGGPSSLTTPSLPDPPASQLRPPSPRCLTRDVP